MKTFIKTLVISSLSLFMLTACSDDIENEGNGNGTTPEINWTSVTMQLSETAQGSESLQDLPRTKADTEIETWPLSTPLRSSDEQLQAIYPLKNVDYKVYLVKVKDGKCEGIATQLKEDQSTLTWFIGAQENSVLLKGSGDNIDANKTLTLDEGDQVYFASQEDITNVTAKLSDVLVIEGSEVYNPIGDILFISEKPLTVHINGDKVIFESDETISTGQKDVYELPISGKGSAETMNIIHLQRATTLLNIQVAIKSEDGYSRDDATYIKDRFNQVAREKGITEEGEDLITNIATQFRARFFFAGYPNVYDMTNENPKTGGVANEYTALSYKWCYPVYDMDYPLVSQTRNFSGFRDMSLPYITPHDFTNNTNITTLFMTFEILGDNDVVKYRGTISGAFAAADKLMRNTNVVTLFTLTEDELDGLLNRPISNSLVTRSAVEDELFGTMLDAKVEVDYLVK